MRGRTNSFIGMNVRFYSTYPFFFCFFILECLKDNIAVDGGRTCNVASRANSGSIDIKFSDSNQIAFVNITASKNSSVTLVCTDVTGTRIFTVSLPCILLNIKFIESPFYSYLFLIEHSEVVKLAQQRIHLEHRLAI